MRSSFHIRAAMSGLTCIAAVCGSSATAQTTDISTPVSVPNAGNADRLRVVPVITVTYDDNILRLSDERSTGSTDNFRISPGVAIGLNRIFGRIRATLGGTAGYDFNTRFKGLNRERIAMTGGLEGPLGARCTVRANAQYERAQFDLADTSQPVSAAYQQQTYDLSSNCATSAGLYPVVGATYSMLSNSARSALDSNQVSLRGGIGYAKPSLGTVQLLASAIRINRPGVEDLLDIDDSTAIGQVQIVLTRSVAPRIGFRLGAGVLHANPRRSGVASFTGPSFDGEINFRPVPRLTITASASRSAANQAAYSATYIISDLYGVLAAYRLSDRSSATLYGRILHRDPRGESLLQFSAQRGEDTLRLVGASYAFDFHRALRLNIGVVHRMREAENNFYDFEGNTVSASIQARF